jgi:HD-GYP domain-containing protein (c-di-GMP phosphodiesterase class II)
MLVVPMQNREGETIGVLQLINKKPASTIRLSSPDSFEKNVLPFTAIDEQLVSSLASQAAISVENNALYHRIETLFDDFVEASVMAIESRDPVTRGHSRRVALMTVELARVTHRAETGPYGELRLSDEAIRELKYAALLHDFGKVGVKEKVLQKGNKLLSGELSLVRERFRTIRRTVEVEHLRRMMQRLVQKDDVSADEIQSFEQELSRDLAEVDSAWEEIQAANKPTVTHFSIDTGKLDDLGTRFIQDTDGSRRPYLEAGELLALKIPRGTLTDSERKQIQTHVVHTYEFLSKIPWTRDLQGIPKLARGHHEKLDGSGYPYGLVAAEIPPQTRMMTISDIFDALAAQDRPYKPRVPTDRALDILREEAQEGKLDTDLLDLFIEAKVYRFAG